MKKEKVYTINEEQDSIIKKRKEIESRVREIERTRNVELDKASEELSDLQKRCKHPLKFQERKHFAYDNWTECTLCGKEL